MKKLLAMGLILALCLMCFGAAAEEEREIFTAGDYEYALLTDGTAEITGYSGQEEALLIPDILDGHAVTRIGDYAFRSCSSLTSVIIPDSVTAIGDGAFFSCSRLTSVTIGQGVTALGSNPFDYCTVLTEINVSPDHPYLAIIDGVLFSKPDKRLVCYPCAFTAETYTIPQGIRVIGDNAFYDCSSLAGVTISDSVTEIGDGAFYDCRSLTSVTIPQGVTSIGDFAFFHCEALTGMAIPDGVTSIGDNAFSICYSLTSVTIGQGVTEIGRNPFAGCMGLTDINVSPDHPYLAIIDGVLFSKQDKRLICYPCAFTAETYDIPQGIRVIGDFALSDSYSLISVTIPDSVTDIGRGAFDRCPLLTLTVGRDSFAEQYCIDNGLKYQYVDAMDWLND